MPHGLVAPSWESPVRALRWAPSPVASLQLAAFISLLVKRSWEYRAGNEAEILS